MSSPPPPESAANGGSSKRQRRPNVRLGDPGQPPAGPIPFNQRSASSPAPRPLPKPRNRSSSPSPPPSPGDETLEILAVSARRGSNNNRRKKPRLAAPEKPRGRSAWASKPAEDADPKSTSSEDSDSSDSDSAEKARILEAPPAKDAAGGDSDGPEEWDGNGNGSGVRAWLERLGLGRYMPVFEIHEVGDDVLPLLTVEDLKEMGINAVGSRRKIYCEIQKLGKDSC